MYDKFTARTEIKENGVLSLEGSFVIEILAEWTVTLPALILMALNSNAVGWTGNAVFAILVSSAMLIRNLGFCTIYATRKWIDGIEDAKMRPQTAGTESMIQNEKFAYIQAYLMDPHDCTDEHGNTHAHQVVVSETDISTLKTKLQHEPHFLFMLNKEGHTPLDTSIMLGVKAVRKESQLRLAGNDDEAEAHDKTE